MATLTQFSVDSLDLSIEDIEPDSKVPSLIGQQQTGARDGSDSGLDTASLSNTSYELLRGISNNSNDYEPNLPHHTLNLACEHFEQMKLSSTPTATTTTITPITATNKNCKNLQRAASLSRTQRSSSNQNNTKQPLNDSKSLVRQSQSLCSNTRSLQRTPSLARTRQLSMPRHTPPDTARRLSSVNGLATLPRSCRQKSVDDLSSQNSRSSSVARSDAASSRMYNSMLSARKNPMTTSCCLGNNNASKRRPSTRTTIYHEIATQTALTQSCLEQLLEGKTLPSLDLRLRQNELSCEQQTQTYIRDQQLEQAQQMGVALQVERKQRQSLEQRLIALASRGNDGKSGVEDVNAALLLLENLLSLSGCELKERQQECAQLRLYCRTLQQSLQQCMQAQECLVKEHEEQLELNEFMQHEKTALEVQLRDMEADNQVKLEERNAEIRILRGECCHLVRLNEQRRQENSLMQTRYKALETRQKNILCVHNSVVMQALNAVAELYTRLDNLLQHLITAYNIGEIEKWDELLNGEQQSNHNLLVDADKQQQCSFRALEMMTLQNQHATTITCNEDLSPECNRSFIAAIIEAIRNATTPARKRSNSNSKEVSSHHHQQQQQMCENASVVVGNFTGFNNALEDESDSTEMLDSETEPCLMMDNVLEDVTLPDSHSHNMVSSSQQQQQQQQHQQQHQQLQHDESLHNLSQAIVNRQQAELQALRNVSLDGSDGTSVQESFGEASILTEETPLKAVVERVVELDSLVTKLLKALHLVQTENNNVIQQLILDKNELQQSKEELLEQLRISDEQKQHFKREYENIVCQLREKERDLSKAKADVQRQRNDIDRLTEDICNLSTLCHKYKQLSPTTTKLPGLMDTEATEDSSKHILELLSMWQKQGYLRNQVVQTFITTNVSTELETVRLKLNVYKKHLQHVVMVLNNAECKNEQENILQKLQKDTAVLLQNVEVMSAMDVNANSNEKED